MSEKLDDIRTNEMKRRRVLQGAAGAGLASMAGCIGQVGGGGGGDLRIAQAKSPVEFDPIVLNDVPSSLVASQIFEGLYHYDDGTGHVPILAKKMPEVSKGGTRFTVPLNDKAKFQNGDPVTAEDVKYSFLAPVKEKTENASEVNMIKSVTTVDETTVQFDLKYPYGPFRHTLHRSVVPKSVREKNKKKFNKENPVGSGPFTFVDWTQGEFAEVERWGGYWADRKPNLQSIRFVPVKEPTTRVTTLKNGENHIIQGVPPKVWQQVKGMSNAGIESEPAITYFYLAFNCKEGPTTSKKVREAIDYAFSMDRAVENFVTPSGVRQYSPLPRSIAEDWNMPLDDWKGIPHSKNTNKAASMLEDAGVPKDYSWKIIVPPDDKREQIGITVGNGLKAAGFQNVTVQRLNWGPFLKKYITGKEEDYNMYTLGWAGLPDPSSFCYPLFGRTKDTLGVTNGCFYGAHSQRGKKAAKMIKQARQTANRDKRQKLYEQSIQMILEDRAHIPAYNLKNSFGVANKVKDFDAHPVSQMHIFSSHNNTSLKQ